MKTITVLVTGIMMLLGDGVSAEPVSWPEVAEEVVQRLDAAEAAYRSGNAEQARNAVIEAYFGVFEDRKLEAAMRKELGARYTYGVERRFGELRKAVMGDAELAKVHGIAEELRRTVRQDAQKLDKAGIPLDVFQMNKK